MIKRGSYLYKNPYFHLQITQKQVGKIWEQIITGNSLSFSFTFASCEVGTSYLTPILFLHQVLTRFLPASILRKIKRRMVKPQSDEPP